MRPAILPAFFFLFASLIPISPACAGSFTVTPVGAIFQPGRKMTSLTVTNGGDTSSLIQLELFDWDQADGKDVLSPTSALIAAPPVFTIGPGKSQVIRLALKSSPDANVEKSFRLFVTEVPAKDEGDGGKVNVAMRISLPVFVLPESQRTELVWKIRREDGNKAVLTVANKGTVHTHVGTVKILNCGRSDDVLHEAKLADYVFPGHTRSWNVTLRDAAEQDCQMSLVVEAVNGKQEIPLQKENFLRQ